MQPSNTTQLHYPFPSNPPQFPTHYGLTSHTVQGFNQLNEFSNSLYQFNITPQIQEFNHQSTCFSNNSTSDEADEQQLLNVINERKKRRMISNRESARRSRMRKQRHLDELSSQVVWLLNENQQLTEKLNGFVERHDQVLKENSQLKKETSELREIIADMQLSSLYSSLREPDDELVIDLPF